MELEYVYTDAELLRIYREALIRIDANNLYMMDVLKFTRIGWDGMESAESVLKPFNEINKLIDDAMPDTIKTTRPTKHQMASELAWERRP